MRVTACWISGSSSQLSPGWRSLDECGSEPGTKNASCNDNDLMPIQSKRSGFASLLSSAPRPELIRINHAGGHNFPRCQSGQDLRRGKIYQTYGHQAQLRFAIFHDEHRILIQGPVPSLLLRAPELCILRPATDHVHGGVRTNRERLAVWQKESPSSCTHARTASTLETVCKTGADFSYLPGKQYHQAASRIRPRHQNLPTTLYPDRLHPGKLPGTGCWRSAMTINGTGPNCFSNAGIDRHNRAIHWGQQVDTTA